MGKSREIKNRIKAVKNIQRITRTMQMIATSKFAKAQQAATASRPYNDALFDLVGQLTAAAGDVAHPLLKTANPDAPELVLVISSERGLCGPYNGNVLRTALAHIRSKPGQTRVEVVGRKGAGVLRFAGVSTHTHHTELSDTPRYDEIERLAQGFIDAFVAGEISSVRVVYMKYISVGAQKPEVFGLLPFEPAAEGAAQESASGANKVYEFSPDAEGLLAALLPAAVKSVLFQSFNDATVSEHIARMVAMKSATDNAAKMGTALKRRYNRARQAQITTELTEIVSGAAALG